MCSKVQYYWGCKRSERSPFPDRQSCRKLSEVYRTRHISVLQSMHEDIFARAHTRPTTSRQAHHTHIIHTHAHSHIKRTLCQRQSFVRTSFTSKSSEEFKIKRRVYLIACQYLIDSSFKKMMAESFLHSSARGSGPA